MRNNQLQRRTSSVHCATFCRPGHESRVTGVKLFWVSTFDGVRECDRQNDRSITWPHHTRRLPAMRKTLTLISTICKCAKLTTSFRQLVSLLDISVCNTLHGAWLHSTALKFNDDLITVGGRTKGKRNCAVGGLLRAIPAEWELHELSINARDPARCALG